MNVIEIAKGSDWAVEYRIRAGDGHGKPITVVLNADAAEGDTDLTILPDHPALSDGDVLMFSEDVLVVLDDDCDAGEQALSVVALPCALDRGNELVKLLDMTGKTCKAVVLPKRGALAADAILASTAITVTIPTQTGEDYAKVLLSCLAAATASKTAGSYFGAFWRTDSGDTRPLDEFTFKLNESAAAGFA